MGCVRLTTLRYNECFIGRFQFLKLYQKFVYRTTSKNSGCGGGGLQEAHKMSGEEGGRDWSKLCNLRGRVSTLALILEGEM